MITLPPQLENLQRTALTAGGAALAACVVGALLGGEHGREQLFESYLLGFLFWMGLSLGCFAVLLLHHTFGAGWGFSIQRILEAGTRTFPVMAALFLPLLAGLGHLYRWSHADAGAADPVLRHKSAYLNVPFFVGRAVLYFLVWMTVAWILNKWSERLDQSGDPELAERLRNLGPAGLLVYGLTVTFATVDWAMSLDPHWFSTMFALIFIAGQVLSALAFSVLILTRLTSQPPLSEMVRPNHVHDLGNLMLAFTMIWSYLSFSQFLIIWSGNLPETITWYEVRSTGGWQWLAAGMGALCFALPFVLLLSRQTKRRIETLARVAQLVLVMRLVDIFWVVAPTFHARQLTVSWMDVAAPLGIGGIWLAFFLRQLKARPLLPERDPRMQGAFAHAEGH